MKQRSRELSWRPLIGIPNEIGIFALPSSSQVTITKDGVVDYKVGAVPLLGFSLTGSLSLTW